MGNETNITCEEVELSSEQNRFVKDCAWWIENCGNLPVGIVGVLLNSIALFVLATPSMRSNFFNRLLFILAIFDNIYLSCEISEVFRHRYRTFGQQHIFVNFVYPVRSVFMCSSIFMTIVLTLERYQAITNPVEYRIRSSQNMMKRLFYYVLPVLTMAVFYYTPKFLDLNVDEVMKCSNGKSTNTTPIPDDFDPEDPQYGNCTIGYPLIPTALRVHHHYVLWYINISNLLLTAIMPVCLLLYMNCKIYSSLKGFMQRQPSQHSNVGQNRRNQTQDLKKTFILFSIVILFVLCHTIRIVLNIDEFLNLAKFKEHRERGCDDTDGFWTKIAVPINQLLIIVNSSGNFFIYSFFDPSFQQVLRQVCIIRSVLQNQDEIHDDSNTNRTRRTVAASEIAETNEIELSNMNNNV